MLQLGQLSVGYSWTKEFWDDFSFWTPSLTHLHANVEERKQIETLFTYPTSYTVSFFYIFGTVFCSNIWLIYMEKLKKEKHKRLCVTYPTFYMTIIILFFLLQVCIRHVYKYKEDLFPPFSIFTNQQILHVTCCKRPCFMVVAEGCCSSSSSFSLVFSLFSCNLCSFII